MLLHWFGLTCKNLVFFCCHDQLSAEVLVVFDTYFSIPHITLFSNPIFTALLFFYTYIQPLPQIYESCFLCCVLSCRYSYCSRCCCRMSLLLLLKTRLYKQCNLMGSAPAFARQLIVFTCLLIAFCKPPVQLCQCSSHDFFTYRRFIYSGSLVQFIQN